MIQAITICHIDLADIDFSDTSYHLFLSTQESVESLSTKELQLQALLHPPLVLKSKQRYIPVSGHILLEQLMRKQPHSVHALVLEKKQLNQFDIFTIMLQHCQIHGDLTSMDLAVFCHKALVHFSKKQLLQLLPAMGIKKNEHVLNELLSLLNLEKNVQRAIHEGVIVTKQARHFFRFSHNDQKLLAQVIRDFQFGGSKQRNFLEAMGELVQREAKQAQYFFDLWEQEEKEKQLNGPQKGNSLLEWLKQRCKPLSTKAEHEFTLFVQQINLPKQATLQHTPAFEDDHITLTIRYPSKKAFLQQWSTLKEALMEKTN